VGAITCIVDHCSIAWSIDEAFSSRGAHNITLQRSIITEPLNMSVHSHYVGTGKGHSFAGSISGDIGSFITICWPTALVETGAWRAV